MKSLSPAGARVKEYKRLLAFKRKRRRAVTNAYLKYLQVSSCWPVSSEQRERVKYSRVTLSTVKRAKDVPSLSLVVSFVARRTNTLTESDKSVTVCPHLLVKRRKKKPKKKKKKNKEEEEERKELLS